jgi:hypothetical protein
MRIAIASALALFLVGAAFAQSDAGTGSTEATATAGAAAGAAAKSGFGFGGGIALGSDVILSGENGEAQTWTKLAFQPDLSFGKIGLGLDLTLHFQLYPNKDTDFAVYGGDWIPNFNNNGKNFFDVYLPKFLYVRYGVKGSDPLFAKLGSIRDLSLGNGFIMSDYSNMHFLPEQRIFGLDVGLDGSLFNFPYVGLEAIAGNLARFDVVGGRLFARPLVGSSIPVLKNMQVGATAVGDTDPYLYEVDSLGASASGQVPPIAAFGADITVPVIGGTAFPMVVFTDIAWDPNQSTGWMLGLSGRLVSVITYGAQLRVLQDGFIPSYFDANYDLYRAQRYDFMQLAHGEDFAPSWFATAGFSFLQNKLAFNAALDGPFESAPIAPVLADADQTDYPHLRAVLRMSPIDKIPVYFDASYDKYYIGATTGFFPDLVDPTDAVIGLNINYKTGAAVLTLGYDAKWNPPTSEFEVTSSLQVAIKF